MACVGTAWRGRTPGNESRDAPVPDEKAGNSSSRDVGTLWARAVDARADGRASDIRPAALCQHVECDSHITGVAIPCKYQHLVKTVGEGLGETALDLRLHRARAVQGRHDAKNHGAGRVERGHFEA